MQRTYLSDGPSEMNGLYDSKCVIFTAIKQKKSHMSLLVVGNISLYACLLQLISYVQMSIRSFNLKLLSYYDVNCYA